MNFVPALNALDKLPNTIKYKDMDADERKARLDLYTHFVRLALEGIVSTPVGTCEPLRFILQVLEHAVCY